MISESKKLKPLFKPYIVGSLPVRRQPQVVPLTADLFSLAMGAQTDPVVIAQGNGPDVLRSVLAPGLSFAIMDGPLLVCALGIYPLTFGRGHGWMLVTPLATPRHLVFATRRTAEQWREYGKMASFKRIEIEIMDGQPWRASFAKALGCNEGPYLMRRWDAIGRDWWAYAKVSDV